MSKVKKTTSVNPYDLRVVKMAALIFRNEMNSAGRWLQQSREDRAVMIVNCIEASEEFWDQIDVGWEK